MFGKRYLRRLAVVLSLIAILLLGIMAAAAATADRFYASRIVAWREADFRDFEKFPSRPVPAGPDTFSFEPAPENPPEYLITVTYRREAPDPKAPRESMAATLESTVGTDVNPGTLPSARTIRGGSPMVLKIARFANLFLVAPLAGLQVGASSSSGRCSGSPRPSTPPWRSPSTSSLSR